MSSAIKMKFKGLDAFISGVEKQPKKIQKEIDGAIWETAQRVERAAKLNAPVDTGYLRQNIVAKKTGNLTARVDSFAFYSFYQEYGTRKMAAHPYFRPAINNEYPRLFLICQAIVNGGIK
ncbi:phage protein [Loigolactobacillus coryniformis subsp. torquens DSM 20004 = KCTC 3535]|uniref:Uncharacterized protein n=2 Tax=Loigolactobacillus coryniformis TaxID=1610 RepID=A0A2D1KME4_9LACO|nr:hypothetical protein LC20004_05130 [Loigolactobacillus coryniformis subsp. torquens DSM 20004 = KCTC 3535]KRK85638.1 phage protein [Loigolactobacillus coryniformis subsp. torquens DSM 20004 = KCTC 3535]